MKLIVGLGNPGTEYEKTRHNVGFMCVDQLSKEYGIPFSKQKWKGLVGEGIVGKEKVILLKPQTYMNLSGESIRSALDWLKLEIDDMIIIYDDLDLAVGRIRLRETGSAGGHNGIKSIIMHLGSDVFNRVKVGIGRPLTSSQVSSYVLSSFATEEQESIEDAIRTACEGTQCWIQFGIKDAMNKYNIRK